MALDNLTLHIAHLADPTTTVVAIHIAHLGNTTTDFLQFI